MIAFTTATYVLGRIVGFDMASACMHAMFQGVKPPMNVPPPAVVELLHLLELVADEPISIRVDPGSAPHAKMRSRAFAWALRECNPVPDIWVSCDDQCEANSTAVRALLKAVRVEQPRIAIVPMKTRDNRTVNVHGVLPPLEGSELAPITWGGFGLVAMNRAAMQLAWDAHPELEYLDADNTCRRALFLDNFVQGEPFAPNLWFGEDASFWMRLPQTISRVAITDGVSVHAGLQLDVFEWGQQLRDKGVTA